MSQEQSSPKPDAPKVLVLEIVERLEQKVDDISLALEDALTMLRQLQQASGAAAPSGGLGH